MAEIGRPEREGERRRVTTPNTVPVKEPAIEPERVPEPSK